MAAKYSSYKLISKRERAPEKEGHFTKKPKFVPSKGGTTTTTTKAADGGGFKKKPFNKPHNSDFSGEKVEPLSKKEIRIQSKELAAAKKKKRKRHYTLEQELASLWEKMRRRNIKKADRSDLVSEALVKMKGVISEIAVSHVSSRVLQTCVKHCTQEERDAVFVELQPKLLELSCNVYAVHLVKKLLDKASKKQVEIFISSLHGHVASLLRNMVGSIVVEHAYQLGNASQKQSLLLELYSTELQLFKDLVATKEGRLVDLIPKLGLQKSSVVRHMTSIIQPILEKGIVDHSIVHTAIMEYFSIADKSSAADMMDSLSGPLLVRMIHTRDGSKIGILCVKHGSAKARKKIIKGMKGNVEKIARDSCGSMVLVSILTVVDDTKLITKFVLRELQTNLKQLILDKSGSRPLLQLLHPNYPRYFGPEDLASLDISVPSLDKKDDGSEVILDSNSGEVAESEADHPVSDTNDDEQSVLVDGGKKDPSVRREELLVKSGLAEQIIDLCIENTEEFLRAHFSKEVLYEVATGGADQILLPTFAEKIETLHKAIASLAARPKEDGSKEEHILEHFHSNRAIRRLVLDSPTFATILWKTALEGKCEMWAKGHGSKVICAYLESSEKEVQNLAKPELQPLIDSGILKMPEPKTITK